MVRRRRVGALVKLSKNMAAAAAAAAALAAEAAAAAAAARLYLVRPLPCPVDG